MKKSFSILVIATLLICSNASGQAQSSNKYCYSEVVLVEASEGTACQINFARNYEFPVENKDEIIKKIKEFKVGADILNYMSDLGWEYVDKQVVFTVVARSGSPTSITSYYLYTFRKLR